MDTGRLQWLKETARESHRDDVPVPRQSAHPRRKAKHARLSRGLTIEIPHQDRRRFVLAHVPTAEDVPVTDSVLQRNTPLPTGLMRDRFGVRKKRLGRFARHRDRTVVRQPVAPILKTRSERLLDQEPTKAGAVDEELTLDT